MNPTPARFEITHIGFKGRRATDALKHFQSMKICQIARKLTYSYASNFPPIMNTEYNAINIVQNTLQKPFRINAIYLV